MMIYLSDTAVRASPGDCCMFIGSRSEGVSELRGDPDYFRQVVQESCMSSYHLHVELYKSPFSVRWTRYSNWLGNK